MRKLFNKQYLKNDLKSSFIGNKSLLLIGFLFFLMIIVFIWSLSYKYFFDYILFTILAVVLYFILFYIIVELLLSRKMLLKKTVELESSRSWFHLLLNSSVDAIHILDLQGNLIEYSPSFLHMLGYSDFEDHSLTLYDFEAKLSKEEIDKTLNSISELPITFESILRTKDETFIDVEITAKLIHMDGRKYIYASARNISARKSAQIALETEKSIAQNYLDIVNVMILVLDTSKKVQLLNRRGCEIIGYSSDEVIGKDWVENFLPKIVRKEVIDVRDRLVRSDQTASYYENSVLTKSKEERLIAWHNIPLFDTKGDFMGILCSGEDITDIRHAQIELKESKEFYETMFASLNDAIIILQDNIIKDCNNSALVLLERDKKSLIGVNILDTVYDIECKEYTFHHYLHCAHQGEYKTAECSFHINANLNEVKILEFTLSKFGGKDENKLIMVARDITKQVEDEKLLKMHMKQAQMGEMISMIAHQWRQPLAIINAIASQMRLKAIMSNNEGTEFIENLVKIEQQSVYMSQTISDYRNFFSTDKPKEYCRASSLIKNALSLIDHTLKSYSIKFEKNILNDAIIYTYRNEVLHVLIVLLKNSIDMFAENKITGGKIVISVDHDDKFCSIHVYDNAGGISKNIIKKLFIPYFTTKNKSNGTGLGLYMSRLIIHEHCEGQIDVSSEGNETVFTVKLPYTKEVL